MSLNLSVDDVLTTTRSVRKPLDLETPVPREVLLECLELALQAPTGSNAQGWQWVLVEDADKRKALADIYRTNATPYLDLPKPEYGDARDEQRPGAYASAKYLNEHLHEVPVALIPCLAGRPAGAPAPISASCWGSRTPITSRAACSRSATPRAPSSGRPSACPPSRSHTGTVGDSLRARAHRKVTLFAHALIGAHRKVTLFAHALIGR